MYIQKVKDLLYSGQKVNIDLAISIMQGFGLDWNSAGFEEEKELVNLCGVGVFCEVNIKLRHLELKAIPASVSQLQNLKHIWLGGNQLSCLPESISQLQKLEWLELSDNQIATIPSDIGQLRNLKGVNFKNNQIKAIPESIGQLQKLEWLGLGHNPISESEVDKIKALLPNCNVIF